MNKKYVIGIISLISLIGITLADYIFDFDPTLETYFPGYTNNLSYLSFEYGPNSLVGAILPLGQIDVEDTTIEAGGDIISGCNKQIKGLYYNSARGNRIRPLDIESLDILRTMSSSYDTLELTGGLYLNCSGQNPDQIYGQIIHSIDNVEYRIVAGVQMDFDNNSYYTGFDTSILNQGGYLTGFMYDNIGGIAKIQYDDEIIGALYINTNSDTIFQDNSYYTDTTGIQVTLTANKEAIYSITGDTIKTYTGTFSGNTSININISDPSGTKSIVTTFKSTLGGGAPYAFTSHIILDRIGPITPDINQPGEINIATTTSIDISWTSIIDTGIGLEQYNYYITSGSTTILSGYTTGTNNNIDIQGRGTGTYSGYIKAIDKFGFYSISEPITLNLVYLPDIEPDPFDLNTIHDAELNTTYKSDIVVVHGLHEDVQIIAEISRGTLFIDGEFVGKSGFVKNDSALWVELNSSNEYDGISSTTLYIGSQRDRFVIYNKDKDRVITRIYDYDNDNDDIPNYSLKSAFENSAKAKILYIFNKLKRTYSRNPIIEKQFFYLLRSKVSDQIEKLEKQLETTSDTKLKYDTSLSLGLYEYLYGLVINHISTMGKDALLSVDDIDKYGKYTAPNGKSYEIIIDYSRGGAITSPDFIIPKYFPTWEQCKSYIDANNISSPSTDIRKDIATASNGKEYHILYDQKKGLYYSPEFINTKYFATKTDLLRYIDIKNPGPSNRNHTSLDKTWTTKTYTAYNGKKFTIQRSDKGFFTYQIKYPAYYKYLIDLLRHIEVWNNGTWERANINFYL